MSDSTGERPDPTVLLALGRLEGKLDVAVTRSQARLDEHDRRLDNHEERLGVLDERDRDRATKVAGLIASKPKPVWPAAAVALAALAFVFTLASAIYSK